MYFSIALTAYRYCIISGFLASDSFSIWSVITFKLVRTMKFGWPRAFILRRPSTGVVCVGNFRCHISHFSSQRWLKDCQNSHALIVPSSITIYSPWINFCFFLSAWEVQPTMKYARTCDLWLDSCSSFKVHHELRELQSPIAYSSRCFSIVEQVMRWLVCNDMYFVRLKVMAKLTWWHDHCIGYLL